MTVYKINRDFAKSLIFFVDYRETSEKSLQSFHETPKMTTASLFHLAI